MFWSSLFGLFLIAASCYSTSLKYSPFNCGDAQWNISYHDNAQASKYMMDWLKHWQFDCDSRSIYAEAAHNGGLGSSFMFGSKYFMEGLEYRTVFRPNHGGVPWLWADSDPSKCTLGRQSYDCFSEPISDCGGYSNGVARSAELLKELQQIRQSFETNPLHGMAQAPNMDICTFGSILQKPVKWVHGNLIWYMLRPLPRLQAIIDQRVKQILYQVPKGTVSMSLQVRSGPMIDERTPLTNISHVLNIVDTIVAEIEQHRKHLPNSKVGLVFLSSDLPEMTYQSGDYMNANFPRHFKWASSHHVSLGSGVESELYIASHNGKIEESKEDLFVDFMTDVEVMTNVDYLVGSKSNVYMIAALLRMLRQHPSYRLPRNTCFVNYGSHGSWQRVCEGDPFHHETWKYYFNPAYTEFETYPTTYSERLRRR